MYCFRRSLHRHSSGYVPASRSVRQGKRLNPSVLRSIYRSADETSGRASHHFVVPSVWGWPGTGHYTRERRPGGGHTVSTLGCLHQKRFLNNIRCFLFTITVRTTRSSAPTCAFRECSHFSTVGICAGSAMRPTSWRCLPGFSDRRSPPTPT